MKKILAIVLCLVMVLGVVGCQSNTPADTDEPKQTNDNNTPANTDAPQTSGEPAEESPYVEDATFRYLYPSEISTLNYLATSSTVDFKPASNFVDTLIEYDQYGVVKPCLATSWETSDDGLVWTFHLREGVKWYDYTGKEVAPVTAQDFVDAAIYALDAKNASSTEYMMEGIIANATEYYKYTSYLLESENGTKTTDEDGEAIEPVAEVKPEDVGVKAVDDLTLEYTLVQPTPYFLSVLNYGCYLPANGAFMQSCIAEDGTDMFGTDNTKLLYNGAYILSTFEPQGRRIMTKNPNYWDKDNVFIDAIEETYNKEMDTIAPEMFKRNETDLAYLSADILDAWLAACALCVTMRIVCPSALISPNTERSADAAFESSAPVGSSARISLGFVINALATAARCF